MGDREGIAITNMNMFGAMIVRVNGQIGHVGIEVMIRIRNRILGSIQTNSGANHNSVRWWILSLIIRVIIMVTLYDRVTRFTTDLVDW